MFLCMILYPLFFKYSSLTVKGSSQNAHKIKPLGFQPSLLDDKSEGLTRLFLFTDGLMTSIVLTADKSTNNPTYSYNLLTLTDDVSKRIDIFLKFSFKLLIISPCCRIFGRSLTLPGLYTP